MSGRIKKRRGRKWRGFNSQTWQQLQAELKQPPGSRESESAHTRLSNEINSQIEKELTNTPT